MKTAEIHLPYFKQGDDLAYHLARTRDVAEALEAHARQMESVSESLRSVKTIIAGQAVEIDADTHMIQIDGPDEIIDRLVEHGLAEIPQYEDEEEELAGDEREERWSDVF